MLSFQLGGLAYEYELLVFLQDLENVSFQDGC